MNISDASHSVYIPKKVDEYILLSKTTFDRIKNFEEDLSDYKMKIDQVFADPEMHKYLITFIDVITNTYRLSEMICKDIYQYTNVSSNQLSNHLSTVVGLVPMIGELAWPPVDLSFEAYQSIKIEQIKEIASNIVNTFYDKEIEEIAEYVCVSFLYENRDHFKQLVFNEKNSRENEAYKSYSEIITDKILKFAKVDQGITMPCETYSTPEASLAYRDATQLINHKMATGIMLKHSDRPMTQSEKCENLKEFLKNVSQIYEEIDIEIIKWLLETC